MSEDSELTSGEVLPSMLRDFVEDKLEDENLCREIRSRLKTDQEFAMTYAGIVREALDSGSIDMPKVPQRPLPEAVVNSLENSEEASVNKAGATERIIAALERVREAGDSAIADFGDRINQWLDVVASGGFELLLDPVSNRREGDSIRVRFKHLSSCGVMAITELQAGMKKIHVVVKPAYLEKFLVMVVSLDSDVRPIFKEVHTNNGSIEVYFEDLAVGHYAVSIEPSQEQSA